MFRKFMNHEKGITGLETAIILIAFVVVAAVFAYTALSAGLFSTQKGQEAVYAGLKEARSTLELRGGVIATADQAGAAGRVESVSFVVANVLGGEAIDFSLPEGGVLGVCTGTDHRVVINYIDENQTVNDLWWDVTKLGTADDDYLLENNEKFKIIVGGAAGGDLIDALTVDLNINTTFSMVIQTPVGAVLEIERTTPPYLDVIMNLR